MKHRFEVLDIFRGIFSSMVVFFHLSPFADTIILDNNLIRNSDLFVDFFFVLSGFVISYTYQTIRSTSEVGLFLKKRFLRLYPLHVILLFVFVFIGFAKHYFVGHIKVNDVENANNTITTFFSSLFLLNSVKLPGVTDVSWNIPSWSISAEMISYILFAFVILMISKLNLYKIKNGLYFSIVLAAIAVMFACTGTFKLTYSFDYGFLRGIIGFFTGVLCFNAFNRNYSRIHPLGNTLFHIGEVVLLIAIIASVCCSDWLRDAGFIYEILFFIAILVFAFEKGFVSSLLKKSSFLKKVGKYSYSIYMIHALFISLFNIVFIRIFKFPPSAYSYLFIVNYLIIYIISAWTYEYIEMRFNFKKRKAVITS